MKSNPKHVCIDRNELDKATPSTRLQLLIDSPDGPYMELLMQFIVDTPTDHQDMQSGEQKLANVQRICGSKPFGLSAAHEKIAESFEQFSGRHTHDSSFPLVIYPDDLGMNVKETASIEEFMTKIAQNVVGNQLGDKQLSLVVHNDQMIEKFSFDTKQNEFVSVPMHKSQNAVPVQSEDGLWLLETHISKYIDRNAAMAMPAVLEKTANILQKAGYKMPAADDSAAKQQSTFEEQKEQVLSRSMKNAISMEKAHDMVAFIQQERKNVPAAPAFKPTKFVM